jgi:type I restriction enzyme R subunit
MTDESHRSQYKGLALNMRKALPNATFIAFTGTPIDQKKRSTTGKFGSYIDKYTIEQAVEDGATVPIMYESFASAASKRRNARRVICAGLP